jgi:hypothetical protein
MTQAQLNRAVAQATGETVQRIQNMGFNLVTVLHRRSRSRRSRARRRPDQQLSREVAPEAHSPKTDSRGGAT